jgi:teichuronic acid biosynthesis glycosyltransferase TuaG
MNNGSSIRQPLVSVFMPVFNQERYVAAALDSALNQTYQNYEIVISDDCSVDSTPIIVNKYAEEFPEKINFYKLTNKNLGGDAHFELLLEKCKGEYVCMFSGDDIMYPEKISQQMKEIMQFDLACHGHAVNCINESGAIFSEIQNSENKFYTGNKGFIIDGVPAVATSWIVKRSYAQFNPALGFLHDLDMMVKVLRNGRICYVSTDKLGAYRIASSSWSRNLNWKNYLITFSNLLIDWFKSGMYTECIWMILRILVRLPSKLLKNLKKKLGP